jgi:ATP-dependent helicase/DNAse subunit B
MPLTLVTGPANAAKAGYVLDHLREVLHREPFLVVPTSADVAHYERELVSGGVVFGAQVLTFSRLVRELGRVTGLTARPLGPVARERVVRAAIADARLRALAPSAAAPGFAAAAGALFAELQRSLVEPARFTRALRAWGGVPYADELAALYSAYRRRLDDLGRPDRDGEAWSALDALRADPAAWARRPVFFYGFDELTRAQLDAVETLARAAEADVWVTLPYEPGRYALAGSAATVQELAPLAGLVELPERAEHYAGAARPALHHLERGLFEPGQERRAPNGAVRLLEAGGERAEAEIVGAEVLELMRDGVAPEDIAVLVRGSATAGLFAQVLDGYEIPVAWSRRVPLARTRLGAGALAGARAALPGGRADDLLSWLRTPGMVEAGMEAVDALDARVRRSEVAGAREAAARWAPWAVGRLDALAAAATAGGEALLAALVAEAEAIWAAPHARRAAVLGAEERDEARVAAELRSAAAELRALDPALLGDASELLETLGAVEVRQGGEGDGVLLADPLEIRARRFRAVFVCGLQDGEFPRRPVPEPFLDDESRRALSAAAGLRLPFHEDVLDRERSLFYACVSRPQEVLFLSWRSSDEEGEPLVASPFLDDVRALFTDELWDQRGRRLLAEVTWSPREAPTPRELQRAQAAARNEPDPPALPAPVSDAVLAQLAERRTEGARQLETFAACGVRWLVEALLHPQRVTPDPEAMRRGSRAHAVLETTLRRLREATGSARLAPATLPAALEALDAALADVGRELEGARGLAARRTLEADLRRYLRHEAEYGAGLEPEHLEWRFGREGDADGALSLGELSLTGRVDRVDVGPGGTAIVRDYKGASAPPGAGWADGGALQVALYMLAARELLGLEPVAGLYQPLWAREPRPRGLVRDDVPGRYVATDVVDADGLEAALDEVRERALETARELRAGAVKACPEKCSPKGCAYPTICRAGG